ncbi:MAG: putative PEP-binding protein, partial [Candidatus Binatia bacterium]
SGADRTTPNGAHPRPAISSQLEDSPEPMATLFRSIDIRSLVAFRVAFGALMLVAIRKGRGVRRNLELGICGEHGGDPSSVGFCHEVGLDYVSCSPYRVPIAKLAAAQAALRTKKR